MIEKIDKCENNIEKSFTTKVGGHIPSSFSISKLENKHDVYRDKDLHEKGFVNFKRAHNGNNLFWKEKKWSY